MPYPAQVFQILIASPSDVTEERDIAVEVIQEWNDSKSADLQIVLLPLRWETHSAPEYPKRPQEVINRQLVDHCDLLVGVFWTRIGTPTGEADSGTLEEIERVANDGKPVMLYFSQAKQDPEAIDPDQLKKVRAFKKKTFPQGLIEKYKDSNDFRKKLGRQLDAQIRGLVAIQSEDVAGAPTSKPVTDVQLHFADAKNGSDLGTDLDLETQLRTIDNFGDIPDYEQPGKTAIASSPSWLLGVSSLDLDRPNRDFIRQAVTWVIQNELFRPLRFWLKNIGGIGARDVYIDIVFKSDEPVFIVIPRNKFPESAPPTRTSLMILGQEGGNYGSPGELTADVSKIWRSQFEVPALQPQRVVSPETELFIGAIQDTTVTIDATIYADTLQIPQRQTLTLNFKVKEEKISASDVTERFDQSELSRDRGPSPGPPSE